MADRPQTTRPPTRRPNAYTRYLFAYNLISASLWAVILGRVLVTSAQHGPSAVYASTNALTKWVQTLAVLEVLHAALGVVRAPLATTAMQVASRLLLVWGIVHCFPGVAAANSPVYASMLVAWSVTEVVRYSFFLLSVAGVRVPGFVTWARYNLFFALYPLGIGSECWLVSRAVGPAGREWGAVWGWVLVGILLVYVPGSYVLFTHMMAQRRKVMRGLAKKA